MTFSERALEAAAEAIERELSRDMAAWCERYTGPHGCDTDAPDPPKGNYRATPERMAHAALTAALAVDGLVMVNQGALDWLFGEAPDRDGKWFGECEDAMKPIAGKYTRTYWWRSKFRAMLSAAPTGTEG